VLAAILAAPLSPAIGDEGDASVAATCLHRSAIRSTKVLDDQNVLFVMRDKSFYNSALTKHCPAMHRGAPLSFNYADGKLCAGASFTVMMRSGPSSNPMSYWDPTTQQRVIMQGPSFTPGAICELGIFAPLTQDEVKDLIAVTDSSGRSRRHDDRSEIKTERVELPRESSPSPAAEKQ
jgi:hypothetical protein